MSDIIKYKVAFDCQLKDVDKKSRQMIGAFTRYNVLDSDGDIGRKGMFAKTWKENFSRIKHLLNHDVTKPVGKIQKLWEDDDYAYYESTVGTHKLGNDVLDMAESGLLNEHSYGYNVIRSKDTKEGRELIESKQWELSNLTGWGANEFSPLISFNKSHDKADFLIKLSNRQKSLERFCSTTESTDETIELLLLEAKQLTQIILEISDNTTKPSAKDTLPVDTKEALTQFKILLKH